MADRRYTAEEIVTLFRQAEVSIGSGKPTPQACRDVGITVQTCYRWRKEYGGLKRLVAELSLEKQILQEAARGTP